MSRGIKMNKKYCQCKDLKLWDMFFIMPKVKEGDFFSS